MRFNLGSTIEEYISETAEQYFNQAQIAETRSPFHAQQLYAIACKLNPLTSIYWYQLGKLSLALKSYDVARKSLKMAVKLEPDHYESFHSMIKAILLSGRYSEAGRHAESLIRSRDLYVSSFTLMFAVWITSNNELIGSTLRNMDGKRLENLVKKISRHGFILENGQITYLETRRKFAKERGAIVRALIGHS